MADPVQVLWISLIRYKTGLKPVLNNKYLKYSTVLSKPEFNSKFINRFDINQSKSTKETNAINIRIIESQHPRSPTATPIAPTTPSAPAPPATPSTTATPGAASSTSSETSDETQQGYIAALKDGFGFIETISHDKEIFFHFSNVESKPERLEVGLEVEYTVFNRDKGGKISAENVKLLRKGTISAITGKEEVLHGKVVRPLRSVNPDQTEYCGLIQFKNEDGSGNWNI